MKPLCTVFNHSLAFCSELAKIRCEDGRGNDGARHGNAIADVVEALILYAVQRAGKMT